jgi:adenylate kinase
MNEALLLTGVFGTGKTTIAADLAELLEPSPIRHAAIDLDWLTWTNAVTTRADEHHMMLANLRLIVDNYRRHGVQRFILARTIVDTAELDSLRTAIGRSTRCSPVHTDSNPAASACCATTTARSGAAHVP